MKLLKLTALMTALLISAALTGCAAAVTSASQDAPSATPVATPEPKTGIEAVFDKPVTLALVSNGTEQESAPFFDAAAREAQSMGVVVTTTAAGDQFDAALGEAAQNADALVAFLPRAAQDYTALSALGKPVAVYETRQGSVPADMSHLYYVPDGELEAAIDATLAYPPHDAPVRLILLFESGESPAKLAFDQKYDEGWVFPKAVYTAAGAEQDAGAWLTGVLDSYVEGMVDAVFAETPELAAAAGDVLFALGRTDMEVFCPGVTPDVLARMATAPDVFAQAVGRNDALAGVLSVRAALLTLHGEAAVTQAFEPARINAADDGDMASPDSEKALLFNTDWMDTLRAFYGAADSADAQ